MANHCPEPGSQPVSQAQKSAPTALPKGKSAPQLFGATQLVVGSREVPTKGPGQLPCEFKFTLDWATSAAVIPKSSVMQVVSGAPRLIMLANVLEQP